MSIDQLNLKIKQYYLSHDEWPLNRRTFKKFDEWIESKYSEGVKESYFFEKLEFAGIELRNKNVLEVGCGLGGLMVMFAKKGYKVTGIDIDSHAIEIARLRAKVRGVDSLCSFGISREYEIPFPSNYFDCILCFSVLEHVKHPKKLIDEMDRVLKKGGFIFIQTPNANKFYEPHFKSFWLPRMPKYLAKIFFRLRGFRNSSFIYHLNYMYPSKLYKLLRNSNYEICDLQLENKIKRIENFHSENGLKKFTFRLLDLVGMNKNEKIIKLFRIIFRSTELIAIKKY